MAARASPLCDKTLTNEDMEFLVEYFSESDETLTFAAWVTKEKGKKRTAVEDRVLTVGQYRLCTWRPPKVGSGLRLAREGVLLDLSKVMYEDYRGEYARILLQFPDFKFSFRQTLPQGRHIMGLLRNFYSLALIGKPRSTFCTVEVSGPDRSSLPLDPFPEHPNVPFGGLIEGYEAQCVREGIMMSAAPEYRDLLDWIVRGEDKQHINITPTLMQEFEYVDAKTKPVFSLIPLVRALRWNTFYNRLTITQLYRPDAVKAAAVCFQNNGSIHTLDLSELGVPVGFELLGRSFCMNPHCALTSVDLSHNAMRDKGVAGIAAGLGTLSLRVLRLAYCGFGSKGASSLAKAFKGSSTVSAFLEELVLSGNNIGSSGTKKIVDWLLSSPVPTLERLELSNTGIAVKHLASVLDRDVLPGLDVLDVSLNSMKDRASLLLSNALMCSTVTDVDLSEVRMSTESLAGIVGCLVTDASRPQTSVRVNSVPIKLSGAERLASTLAMATNLWTLSLDDCALGVRGLSLILRALAHCHSMRRLSISRNVKPRDKGIDSVVCDLITVAGRLEKLTVQGSPKHHLGSALVPFLQSLEHNQTLQELVVDGNVFGDEGAQALGEALRSNTHLESLSVDSTGITLTGLCAFTDGIQENRTVRELPLPNNTLRRLLIESAGDAASFEKVQYLINQLRVAVRVNTYNVLVNPSTSLFDDSMSDLEWLEVDKRERRARRARRRQAKMEAAAKRRTALDGTLDRANKRGTISMATFDVKQLLDVMAGVGASAAASSGTDATTTAATATTTTATAGPGSAPQLPPQPPTLRTRPRAPSVVHNVDPRQAIMDAQAATAPNTQRPRLITDDDYDYEDDDYEDSDLSSGGGTVPDGLPPPLPPKPPV